MTGRGDHPLTRAFELGVLVPIGLVTVLSEELPRLTELGRRRVQQRIAVARFIGEAVVRQGRREVERRLAAPEDPTQSVAPPPATVAATPATVTPPRTPAPSRRTTRTPTRPAASAPPPSSALPLDDYESLAAGHVVSLLADLSPEELDLIESFETAHRNRRTVLGRITQLRSAT